MGIRRGRTLRESVRERESVCVSVCGYHHDYEYLQTEWRHAPLGVDPHPAAEDSRIKVMRGSVAQDAGTLPYCLRVQVRTSTPRITYVSSDRVHDYADRLRNVQRRLLSLFPCVRVRIGNAVVLMPIWFLVLCVRWGTCAHARALFVLLRCLANIDDGDNHVDDDDDGDGRRDVHTQVFRPLHTLHRTV